MDDCKLVFRYLSQFFHGRWFISNQAEAATPMSVLQRLQSPVISLQMSAGWTLVDSQFNLL